MFCWGFFVCFYWALIRIKLGSITFWEMFEAVPSTPLRTEMSRSGHGRIALPNRAKCLSFVPQKNQFEWNNNNNNNTTSRVETESCVCKWSPWATTCCELPLDHSAVRPKYTILRLDYRKKKSVTKTNHKLNTLVCTAVRSSRGAREVRRIAHQIPNSCRCHRDSSSRSPTVSIPVKIPGRDIDCVQLSVGRWALTISRGPGILEQSECERKALKRSPGVKP